MLNSSSIMPSDRGSQPSAICSDLIGEGGEARINRITYSDGSTIVRKIAKNSLSNGRLVDEYAFLKGKNVVCRTFPEVYTDNHLICNTADSYYYDMEDLWGYYSLDKINISKSLDTLDKYFIIYALSEALSIADRDGYLHKDLALKNVMYNGGDTKLIDWGTLIEISELLSSNAIGAVETDQEKKMKDVNDFKIVLKQLFVKDDLIPELLRSWIAKEYRGSYMAWDDLLRYMRTLMQLYKPETNEIEIKRKKLFGESHFPTLL